MESVAWELATYILKLDLGQLAHGEGWRRLVLALQHPSIKYTIMEFKTLHMGSSSS